MTEEIMPKQDVIMLNNYFDKVYCINLDRRTDRWQFVKNQFEKMDIVAHRFPAYDKEKLQTEVHQLEKQFPKQFEWYINFCFSRKLSNVRDRKRYNRKHIGGSYACAKSHVGVIKEAHRLGLNNVFIFEDDVILSEDFSIQIKCIEQLPTDWDMFYLGGEHVSHKKQISSNIWRACCYCTHAYAINHTLFQHIIEVFDNNPMFFITGKTGGCLDTYYAEIIHPEYKCYIAEPQIVMQNRKLQGDIADEGIYE